MPLNLSLLLIAGLWLEGCASAPPAGPANHNERIRIAGGTIELAVDSDVPTPRPMIEAWVRRAAVAVSGYLGRFPAKHVLLTIKTGGRRPIGGGVTYGDSRIIVRLGRRVTLADLDKDWVLTHEMFHLAFPTLNDRYLWMMEGLSDYLEPVARARAGQITPEAFWRELVENLPRGLPGPGDQGLDTTRGRERIYWGGDLFWFLADVRIHTVTDNRRGVGDAIRAILAAGGSGGREWALDRVIKVGDRATGATVLEELHEELGRQPGHVDLDALWRRLGVIYQDGRVSFDDFAPQAEIRRAITAGPGGISPNTPGH